MEQLNVYYVNLSDRKPNREAMDFLRGVETSRIPEPAQKPENVRRSVHKYLYKSIDDKSADAETFFPVYGSQTNEANLKTVLQHKELDLLLLVVSEKVFSGSGLDQNGELSNNLNRGFVHVSEEQFARLAENSSTLDYFLAENDFYCRNVLDARSFFEKIRATCIYPISDSPVRQDITNCAIRTAEEIIKLEQNNSSTHSEDSDPIISTHLTAVVGKNNSSTHSEDSDPVRLCLYMDSNGGKRDQTIIQIGIIRALQAHGIEACKILYSDFSPAAVNWGDQPVNIQNKKSEYEIFDIVSGIDEFIEYGRVKKLKEYFPDSNPAPIREVLTEINNMCEVFTTCFAEPMAVSVVNVIREIQKFDDPDKDADKQDELGVVKVSRKLQEFDGLRDDQPSELERYIVSEIKQDLGADLWEIKDDRSNKAVFPIIKWCRKKKFYQQAITLYVEKMPAWYCAWGILRETIYGKNMYSASDFYEALFTCIPERDYNDRIDQIARSILSDKEAFVAGLKDLKDSSDQTQSDFLSDCINEISSNYNDDGSRKNQHTQGCPRSLQGYANSIINRRPALEQSISHLLQSLRQNTYTGQDKTNFVCSKLRQLTEIPELYLQPEKMEGYIHTINTSYKADGSRRDDANTNLAKSLSKQLSSQKKGVYPAYTDIFCADESERSAIRKTDGVKLESFTYINKRRGILYLTDDFADYVFFPDVFRENKTEDLKKLMEYYLAFKILRNNSNHANGIGDKNEQIVCCWLRDKGILNLSNGQLGDDTVSLDYTVADHLLQDAIEFHKDLV